MPKSDRDVWLCGVQCANLQARKLNYLLGCVIIIIIIIINVVVAVIVRLLLLLLCSSNEGSPCRYYICSTDFSACRKKCKPSKSAK